MGRGTWRATALGGRSCRVGRDRATQHVYTETIWKCSVINGVKSTRHQIGKKEIRMCADNDQKGNGGK